MNRRPDSWYARFRDNVNRIQRQFGIELTFIVGQSGNPYVRLPKGIPLTKKQFMALKRAFRLTCMLYNPQNNIFYYAPDICLQQNH